MSFAEQKWTVDQVNEKIQSSDAGKDLYIAGIKRGNVIKHLYGTANGYGGGGIPEVLAGTIEGSGWITKLELLGKTTNIDVNAILRVVIDNEEYRITFKTSGSSAIIKSLSINVDSIGSSDELSTDKDIGGVTLNKPIRFNNSVSLYAMMTTTNNYNTTGGISTVSMDYILDE